MSDSPLFDDRPESREIALSSGGFIQMVLSQPDSAEKVQLLRELLAMQREEQAAKAKRDFEADFARIQAELPHIKKTKEVKTRGGRHMYDYAPIEEIQGIVNPILQKYGFSYAWREEQAEGGKRVWFDLMGHGYTRSNAVEIPNLSPISTRDGDSVTNEAQAARATASYGKRNSLCDGLGLIIEGEDNDARIEIDEELAATMKKIRDAKTTEELMNTYQIAYKRYEKEPGQIRLVIGEYNLAKQALARG